MAENSFVYAYLHRLLHSPKAAAANGEAAGRLGSTASTISRKSTEALVPTRTNGHSAATSPTLSAPASPRPSAAPSNGSASPSSSSSETDKELAAICKRVSDPATSKQVRLPPWPTQLVVDLSHRAFATCTSFASSTPCSRAESCSGSRVVRSISSRCGMVLRPHIAGQHFQAYIQRTMQNLAAEDAEREAMSSAPQPERASLRLCPLDRRVT